jgi:SAM-dependent methyltransferase
MHDDASGHERVRRSYDVVAQDYEHQFKDELTDKPLDRALLKVVLEQTETGAPVADLGCGPGHVAAWLAHRGVQAIGIDLSTKMVEIGRRKHPEVEFREGDLLGLPASDAEFGSIVALYSIIHLEPSELALAFGEMRRALRPSGVLLVSFHVGSEVRHLGEWFGRAVDVDFRFFEPEDVVGVLETSGFTVEARLERTNYPHEVETRRSYLLARPVP